MSTGSTGACAGGSAGGTGGSAGGTYGRPAGIGGAGGNGGGTNGNGGGMQHMNTGRRQSEPRPHPPQLSALSWAGLAAACLAVAAVLLFGFLTDWGYLPLVIGAGLGFATSRQVGRDLLLIAGALGLISTISLAADISVSNMALMGAVLAGAVVGPWWVSRYLYRDRAIVFPRRQGKPWTRLEWAWLGFVLLAGWLILPAYFLGTGVYRNWPAVSEWHEIVRLFIGVNAVGIWDELFFICTVFTLLYRHFRFWVANVLTSIIFVSFLWELGYQSIGPLLTIPFALVQAVIFTTTKSLPYTVTVHLLFDAVVFLTIVHAHYPAALPIFPFAG